MSNRLRQLRIQAELILSPSDLGDIPIIHRSLSQMEKEMNRMSDKIQSTQELHAKAHYFLASNGINMEHVSSPIDTSRTFEIKQLENHTDIDKFLSEEHERNLIDTLEKQRMNNFTKFRQFHDELFDTFIQERDSDLMDEDENKATLLGFKNDNSTGITRIHDYANIIKQLNQHRLIDNDFNLVADFQNVRNLSDIDKWQEAAYESWNILGHLVNSYVEGRLEGRFLRDYIAQPYNTAAATNTRRALVKSSRTWLEKQSAEYVNNQVNKNATKIRVGGIPSISHRLRAFIDLVFRNVNGWTDPRLEIVEDLPIWVYVYLLMRIGYMDVAAQYVDEHREMFGQDRRFIAYFEEYIRSDQHSLSEASQVAILADYQRLVYGDVVIDPYKVILYKIIGRCELHQKSSPEIIQSVEDYIWLQLILVREVTEPERFAFERYRLEDVQKDINELGSKYFDRENNPWIYFKILLLTHQFEKAIDHLHKEKKLQLEAIHFAIALAYHGLIRMTPYDKAGTRTLVVKDQSNIDTLNFPRLIYQYVQSYIREMPIESLAYLCLLTLYSTKQGYPNNEYVDLAKSYICKYIIGSQEFKTILGSRTNEQRVPGLLDSIKELLYITTEAEYAQDIIHQVALSCVQSGQRMDAVYAYSLSGDFNSMVDVLAVELSDALQQPQSFRATDPTLSQLTNEEIINFAFDTMNQYEQNQYVSGLIDDGRKNTIRILIQLLQFRVAYEQSRYDIASQLISTAQVIPLEGDIRHIQVYALQFETLADSIKKNIPELLLNIMDILYKIWAEYNNSNTLYVPESESKRLEGQAQAVLLFASLIQFSIPGDIIVRLNKVDRLMSLRRR